MSAKYYCIAENFEVSNFSLTKSFHNYIFKIMDLDISSIMLSIVLPQVLIEM